MAKPAKASGKPSPRASESKARPKKPSARVVDFLRQAGARQKIQNPTQAFQKAVKTAAKLEDEISELESKLTQLKGKHAHLVEEEIPVAMLQMRVVNKDNKGSVSLDDGTVVTLNPKTYPTVLVQDKPLLFDWMKSRGLGGEIKSDVHHNTLTKIVRDFIEENSVEELPAFVKLFKKTKATIKIPK